MERLAADVGVLAGRQVETFDGADPLEHLQRPEDRRAADTQATDVCLGDQLGGREVTLLVGDEGGKRPARLGQAIAGAVEG